MKLAIRRVGLGQLAKFGCLLGAVAAFLPSLTCGLLGLFVLNIVRKWMQGWEDISISVLGQEIAHFDLVHLLGLSKFLTELQSITGASFAVMALLILAAAVAAGLVLGAIVTVVGLVYNLLAAATGGLVVEASQIDE